MGGRAPSMAPASLRHGWPKQSQVHMSSTLASDNQAAGAANIRGVDMKLELIIIPVSDVDRAKRFYGSLGWRLDAEFASDDGYLRRIHFTPPGSGCSVMFGKNVTAAAPGSAQGLYLIVSDNNWPDWYAEYLSREQAGKDLPE